MRVNSVSVFVALSSGFFFTAILGPQWGIIIGLLSYLLCRNLMVSHRLRDVESHLNTALPVATPAHQSGDTPQASSMIDPTKPAVEQPAQQQDVDTALPTDKRDQSVVVPFVNSQQARHAMRHKGTQERNGQEHNGQEHNDEPPVLIWTPPPREALRRHQSKSHSDNKEKINIK